MYSMFLSVIPNKCIQCESKKVSPKTFCNIFTRAVNISVKFCQYVGSLSLHISTSFGGFILLFNKMALIFLGVPIVFNVSISSFIKSNRCDFITNNEWFPIHPISISHWIIRLGEMLESWFNEGNWANRLYQGFLNAGIRLPWWFLE